MPAVLWYLSNRLIKLPPKGSIFVETVKVVRTGLSQPRIKGEPFYESAKPVSTLEGAEPAVSWRSNERLVSPSTSMLSSRTHNARR